MLALRGAWANVSVLCVRLRGLRFLVSAGRLRVGARGFWIACDGCNVMRSSESGNKRVKGVVRRMGRGREGENRRWNQIDDEGRKVTRRDEVKVVGKCQWNKAGKRFFI